MASALMILFLGCWLAGQSGVLGEGTDPAGPQQMDPAMTELEGEGGSGLTEPGQTSVPTCTDSAKPGESERKLSSPIVAGVSVSAIGLLLLLLAFLCYRRKGPAPRQSRELEPATTVYALMGEGKRLDALPQKPDPGAEGHTYAELDSQALQAKQGGAALYSTLIVSQGPNGQSPQGAGEPPTDPHSVNPGGVTGETGQEASATTG
ncbi:uncharacterized protein ACDP82_020126 [Pangshura tecta]